MNYFELYEIPVSMKVDRGILDKKYFELQRKYHPDFYSNASEVEQAEMLERSSMVNKAYKTLQSQDDTIKYVLQLKGLLEEEEKYQLPPQFLMEMMELNEGLLDTDDSSIQETETKITQAEKHLYDEVQNIIEYYSDANTTNEQLLLVKEYYFKKKYLKRITERLNQDQN